LTLTATGLAAIGVSAVAIGAVRSKDRVTIPGQSLGSAIAKCPHGKRAVATGFESPDFVPGDDGGGVVRVTSKVTGNRTVKTRGFNFDREAKPFDSYAYCAKAPHGVQIRSQRAFVSRSGAASTVATCGRRREAVGGGFSTPGFSKRDGPQVITLTSKRNGKRKWKVEGYNMGGDDNGGNGKPGALSAYVYCVKDGPKLVTRRRSTNAPKGHTKTFDVTCPRGTKALSGGFDGRITLTANASAAGAITSRRADGGRKWRTTALSIADKPARVTSYVYCKS
jgi:hypothetical protein